MQDYKIKLAKRQVDIILFFLLNACVKIIVNMWAIFDNQPIFNFISDGKRQKKPFIKLYAY